MRTVTAQASEPGNASAGRDGASWRHYATPSAIGVALILGYLAFIHAYGVNLPFWDDWNLGRYVILSAAGKLALPDLLTAKHNEHLVGVSFALMLLHHLATDYDTKSILYLSAALQFASLAILLALAWPLLPKDRRRGWHALLVSLTMLSLAPAWNILWGFQTAWYLITFFLLASLWFLSRSRQTQRASSAWLAAGALCALLASFSSVQGLAVWLAGAVFLYAATGGGRRALRDHHLQIWLGLTVAAVALHAWVTALTPTPHGSSREIFASIAADPLGLGRFMLATMSTVWGDRLGGKALYAGILIALLCSAGLVGGLASRQVARFAMPLALIVFGFAFALMVTIGRLRFGQPAALESRYSGYLLLAVAGSFLVLMVLTEKARFRRGVTGLRALVAALIVVPFISSAIIGLKTGRNWRLDRGVGAMILLNVDSEPRFKIERTICWSADIVLQQTPQLRALSLSTFARGDSAIPRQAADFRTPPPGFRSLLERRPNEQEALEQLWHAYVVGPDLRRAFPLSSPSMAADLVRWAAESAGGDHYLAPHLVAFAADYERLRNELAADAKLGR